MDWKEQLFQLKEAWFSEQERETSQEQITAAENGHRFERWLRGGWVPSLHLRVPESLVRSLRLEHGDRIECGPNGALSIVEKRGESIPRVEYRFVLLEDAGSEWIMRAYVSRYGGEVLPLVHLDQPITLRLQKQNLERLNLEDGSLVDVAFWSGRPDKPVIVYRHPVTENRRPSVRVLPRKDKQGGEDDSLLIEEGEVVRNKKVLIIGGDPRHDVFEKRIAAYGGEMAGLPGNVGIGNKEKLEREIQKADVVLLMIRMMRHQTFWDALSVCRRLKKPHWEVESMGVKSVFLGAASALSGS